MVYTLLLICLICGRLCLSEKSSFNFFNTSVIIYRTNIFTLEAYMINRFICVSALRRPTCYLQTLQRTSFIYSHGRLRHGKSNEVL